MPTGICLPAGGSEVCRFPMILPNIAGMTEVLLLIAGLAAGAAIGFLLGRSNGGGEEKAEWQRRLSLLELDKTRAEEQVRSLSGQLARNEVALQEERKTAGHYLAENAAQKSNLENLARRLEEQKGELAQLQEKMTVQFRNLANEILEEKTKKFTDQNKTSMGELLNPLKDKITEFEKKVEDATRENLKWNSSLSEQLRSLRELNQRITKEAENLTRALKGESKTQGNWGEMILESILEKSGLVKNREYFMQESLVTAEGRRYQPDVVIRLPENKNIIIDAKVSLVNYESSVNATDEQESLLQLRAHLQSIRTHIRQLSEKNYQNLYGINGLDFVLLFIPIEPAFTLAVQQDNALFNDAYERNIVIVSPTTLFATLRTISSIWRQEYQNRNAQEIARQGGVLYDKFVGFTEDLVEVGKKINATQDSYKSAMGKLTEGRGNLITRAQKLRELGSKTSKSISPNLLDRTTEEPPL